MVRARVFWFMVGISVLTLGTCEARAAERGGMGAQREASNSMSASSQTSSADMAYGGGNEMTASPLIPTPTTTGTALNSGSVTSPLTTTVSSSPTTSNYSTTVNSTAMSIGNSTANSTQPPYVDQYGNNLPEVVNGTQYYTESADTMDTLPVVPLDENGSANGNNVWVVYRIPAGGAAPTQIAPSQVGNVANDRYEIEENQEQTTTTGYPSTMQPDFQAPQQPPGYYVVVQPVEAYQQDYYKMGSPTGAQIKPLNKFFDE